MLHALMRTAQSRATCATQGSSIHEKKVYASQKAACIKERVPKGSMLKKVLQRSSEKASMAVIKDASCTDAQSMAQSQPCSVSAVSTGEPSQAAIVLGSYGGGLCLDMHSIVQGHPCIARYRCQCTKELNKSAIEPQQL
eukprot:1147523-Pelagomonas_calceolata.AAC.2